MSSSIYNIQPHTTSASQEYSLNDIVKHGDYYYYCIKAHDNAQGAQVPAAGSTFWNGTTTIAADTNAEGPYFFWRPSYSYTQKVEPRVRVVSFGGGYEQRVPDGIQNKLLSLELTFSERGESEATAILHFFDARGGAEAFTFYPPKPYNVPKLFTAPSWDSTVAFKDNFGIRVTFLEVAR